MKTITLLNNAEVLVDDEDFEELKNYRWYEYRTKFTSYAVCRSGKNGTMQMHRKIMNAPQGLVVDHIDHNGLNNQKENLRNVTYKQNSNNRRPKTILKTHDIDPSTLKVYKLKRPIPVVQKNYRSSYE